MDFLFSPWRYRYLAAARRQENEACVLCAVLADVDDAANFILARTRQIAVMLNLYPYNSGHLMILPLEHRAWLSELSADVQAQMFSIAAVAEGALRNEYHPQGLNLGINLGEAAGAGIAGHLHLHVLPRWVGDANFMSVIGETRVLPEELPHTYERLKPYFAALP